MTIGRIYSLKHIWLFSSKHFHENVNCAREQTWGKECKCLSRVWEGDACLLVQICGRERECVTKWERERESNWRMFVSKWVNDSKRVHERIVEFCWKRLTEKKITIWDSLRLVKSVLRKLKEYRQSKGYLKVCVKCSVTRCFYYLYYFAICNKEILPSCITYFHCLIKIVPN